MQAALDFEEYTADQVRTATSFKVARDMIIANFHSSRVGKLWLVRGLLAIYARQTADEKSYRETVDDNGVGFSSVDARILSSLAQQVIRFNNGQSSFSSPLSSRQFDVLRQRLPKYAMQLAHIARKPRAAATV